MVENKVTEVDYITINELTSVPFSKVRNRIELLDLYQKYYGGRLCRTCSKDREFTYMKLYKLING